MERMCAGGRQPVSMDLSKRFPEAISADDCNAFVWTLSSYECARVCVGACVIEQARPRAPRACGWRQSRPLTAAHSSAPWVCVCARACVCVFELEGLPVSLPEHDGLLVLLVHQLQCLDIHALRVCVRMCVRARVCVWVGVCVCACKYTCV